VKGGAIIVRNEVLLLTVCMCVFICPDLSRFGICRLPLLKLSLADVKAEGEEYGNALQTACYGGHENGVQMSLDTWADVKAERGVYSNALQAACFGGHEKVVQILLDAGAGFSDSSLLSPPE
jgi:hypothetical protein